MPAYFLLCNNYDIDDLQDEKTELVKDELVLKKQQDEDTSMYDILIVYKNNE